MLFKTNLFARSLAHMLLSREKSGWPKNRPDPAIIAGLPAYASVKRVIFVRHGESTWNEIFNRGFNFRFPLRLFEGLMSELLLLFTKNSYFVDSPLSDLGYDQAKELRRFLRDDVPDRRVVSDRHLADVAALDGRGDAASLIVASNLRRAVATTALAFWDRLARTGEKIYIHSALQEMARNVDTFALAGAGESVPLHGLESHVDDVAETPMGRWSWARAGASWDSTRTSTAEIKRSRGAAGTACAGSRRGRLRRTLR